MQIKMSDVVASVIVAIGVVQGGITTLSLPDGVMPFAVLALATVSAFLVRLTSQSSPPAAKVKLER